MTFTTCDKQPPQQQKQQQHAAPVYARVTAARVHRKFSFHLTRSCLSLSAVCARARTDGKENDFQAARNTKCTSTTTAATAAAAAARR